MQGDTLEGMLFWLVFGHVEKAVVVSVEFIVVESCASVVVVVFVVLCVQ